MQKKAEGVIFADDNLENAFKALPEDDWLKKALQRAINDLKENVFAGERVRKELTPKEYKKKYNIDSVWWYPLPDGWRLIYTVLTPSNVEILAVILEYFDHKSYARRFGYKT